MTLPNAIHYFAPQDRLKHLASLHVRTLKREEKTVKDAFPFRQFLSALAQTTGGSTAMPADTLENYIAQQYQQHQGDHTIFLLPNALSVFGAFTGSGFHAAEELSKHYKTLALSTRGHTFSEGCDAFFFELAEEGKLLLSGQKVSGEDFPCPELSGFQRLGVEDARLKEFSSGWAQWKPLEVAAWIERLCGCLIFPPSDEQLEQEYLCYEALMMGKAYQKDTGKTRRQGDGSSVLTESEKGGDISQNREKGE